MWKLQTTESGGEWINLVVGQSYVVGRKNCEILLTNDQSISRVHATLTVTEKAVVLKDSSKYGTFINDEKLETGCQRNLQTGDKITFGVFQSKYCLKKECIVVCSSCVDNEGKASLSQDVASLGGRVVSSWTLDCTHLVMPTVKVTIKTICALLCARPIVKPEFFSVFSKAVQQKLPPPKEERFMPEMDEPSLAKEEMKRLSQAVFCGGGVSQLLEEGSLPISLLESSSSCVVDLTLGSSQAVISPPSKKWLDSLGQVLHSLFAMVLEPVKMKPGIAAATLSQNNIVDETALAPASQNTTAYVLNTELSQERSRMVTSGVSAVSETPEKTESKPKASEISKTSSLGPEPSSTRVVNETVMSSESLCADEPVQRMNKAAFSDRRPAEGSVILAMPGPSRTTQKSLANFFQPVGKKRPREDASTVQSEAKFLKKKSDDEMQESSRFSQKALQNLSESSPSHTSATSSVNPSKKRKEPDQDVPSIPAEPGAADYLGLSLDEIESIMSEEIEEPLQTSAPKKQCLESSGTSSTSNNKDFTKRQKDEESNIIIQGKKNQKSGSRSIPSLQLERTSLGRIKQAAEGLSNIFGKRAEAEELKEEEVSFAVNSKTQNGISSEAVLKQEMQVQFMSLMVSTSSRPRSSPLQTHDLNQKNVKRFRKKIVPGSSGLPKIIGGSDLVAHSRSKDSEMEEWLREAAKEEKQNKQEESLGDDLFRYNPRPAKKR
ncbi:hypothetical protein DNTS_025733 [Danionella cerebrum]|uniref:FHA domain-containing protein n=1 Tax=Danionella cerebrum TaxID=2873325 RepID=A0A553RD02_9TELE|nr:hypothetical protein DNTS_025733 [Danionella translucida]